MKLNGVDISEETGVIIRPIFVQNLPIRQFVDPDSPSSYSEIMLCERILMKQYWSRRLNKHSYRARNGEARSRRLFMRGMCTTNSYKFFMIIIITALSLVPFERHHSQQPEAQLLSGSPLWRKILFAVGFVIRHISELNMFSYTIFDLFMCTFRPKTSSEVRDQLCAKMRSTGIGGSPQGHHIRRTRSALNCAILLKAAQVTNGDSDINSLCLDIRATVRDFVRVRDKIGGSEARIHFI